MFANGPGDLGSIPGRVIPKTQKMVLDASLLNTQHYKVRIKGKVEQSREGVAPSPTHRCSSYRKGSLRVTLDYGRQLYFTYLYINDNGFSQISTLVDPTISCRKSEVRIECFCWNRNDFEKLWAEERISSSVMKLLIFFVALKSVAGVYRSFLVVSLVNQEKYTQTLALEKKHEIINTDDVGA